MEAFIVGVILSVIFCLFLGLVRCVGNIGKPKINYNLLLDAIGNVETNNDYDCVVGDGGAVGRYQLRKTYVDDVNRILAKSDSKESCSFTYDDRLDHAKSVIMVGVYWHQYAKQPFHGFLQIEDYVAIHKAGPKGHKKLSEDKQLQTYVAKVKKEYDKLLKG